MPGFGALVLGVVALLGGESPPEGFTLSAAGLIGPGGAKQVFRPEMVGEWYTPDWKSVAWRVDRIGQTSDYVFTQSPGDGATGYIGRLAEIGGGLYLDLTPIAAGPPPPGGPPHLIGRLDPSWGIKLVVGFGFDAEDRRFHHSPYRKYESLKLSGLDEKALKADPKAIKHNWVGDGIAAPLRPMLAASTPELVAFVTRSGSKVFNQGDRSKRVEVVKKVERTRPRWMAGRGQRPGRRAGVSDPAVIPSAGGVGPVDPSRVGP